MKERLRNLWQSRAPRERVVIIALAAILGAALYLWLLQSAGRARLQLGSSVSALRAQAARLDRDADELQHLRAAPAVTLSQTDLRALVQAQAGAAGLSRGLLRNDALGANQVQVEVEFGAVAFADWLALVAGLQAQQVRLDTCRIEALSTPGLVSVTATFARAKPL